MKWILRGILALAGVAVIGALFVSSRGSFERVRASARDSTASGAALWRVCLSRRPRSDRKLLARCVRVQGVVLHVWQKHDADGTLQEEHLLVLAHFNLYVVKALPPFRADLALGTEIAAVGPLVRPRPEHLGIHEVEAFSLSIG